MADTSAGEVVTASLRELVRQFDETEPAALAGEPEGVHEHRTVVRRLRSVLRVFGDLFDPFAETQLRQQLTEWGAALGVVRDHEVAAELAAALLADVPAASLDQRVTARLVEPERDAASTSHLRLVEIHALPRLQEMRRALHAFAADPPLSPAADVSAAAIGDTLVETARSVRRKARKVTASLDSQHTLRKRARRLRHAVEAAMTNLPGLFDKRMKRLGKAAHGIQSALGDHRDATLLADRIGQERVLAGRAGEDTQVYDDLALTARAFAAERLHAVPKLRKKLGAALESLADG